VQLAPLYGHTGALPGYNSFMGYDPVNHVTIVAWGNPAPAANGFGPAEAWWRGCSRTSTPKRKAV
jgi:D-alanyl-D-alanine carboxypeptidase